MYRAIQILSREFSRRFVEWGKTPNRGPHPCPLATATFAAELWRSVKQAVTLKDDLARRVGIFNPIGPIGRPITGG